MLAAGDAQIGALAPASMAMNAAAPSATAGVAASFYGVNTGGGSSVFNGAFGIGGGSFDLAKDAIGGDVPVAVEI